MNTSQSPSVDGADHDEDHDLEDDGEADGGSKGGGKKKNVNNQAARRDQNRIAQREFRLRKQQRIRDLEARVELLSGSKEETHTHSREIIRSLIEENSRLRGLLRDLGGFLGDGLGGPLLDKTGWDMQHFQDFVSKADSDTAYEAYTIAKKAGAGGSSMGNGVASGSGAGAGSADPGLNKKRKRSSLGAPGASVEKGTNGNSNGSRTQSTRAHNPLQPPSPNELPSLLPSTTASRHSYSNRTDHRHSPPKSFTSLMDTLSSSAGAPYINLGEAGPARQLPPPANMPRGGDPFGSTPGSGSSYHSPLDPYSFSPRDSPTTPSSMTIGNISGRPLTTPDARSRSMLENVPKKDEAGKLISYHLQNYNRSSQYFLPTSLRPTLVQRTVPHDNLIDGIVYPEVRDRMILMKARFSLPECLTMYLSSVIVHGDDVLASANWELGEDWLRTYGFLVDEGVLTSVNRWRRERGDAELLMAEIIGEVASPS